MSDIADRIIGAFERNDCIDWDKLADEVRALEQRNRELDEGVLYQQNKRLLQENQLLKEDCDRLRRELDDERGVIR